ncbi:hypothetical protein [Lewinella sp. IMCC34183]|uniref:hypothetical protein n=1 Tax=Lewinella sp. IMCC34183 TaxID=2248762 RepID=UPI000E245838|nr:hypothetical protein [Lewinella sp. IMCC34183]
MPTQDSFDRQFRRTALGLRRRPAPRTWDRIEARLDRRTRGPRWLGVRPWVIAAVIVLVAGVAALTHLALPSGETALAQRAESVEELTAPGARQQRIPDYAPVEEGRPDGQLLSRSEPRGRLAVAPKYRL